MNDGNMNGNRKLNEKHVHMHVNVAVHAMLMSSFVADCHQQQSTTTATNRHVKGLFAGIMQGPFASIELDNKWIAEKKN